jgi:hypothetical protein
MDWVIEIFTFATGLILGVGATIFWLSSRGPSEEETSTLGGQ